jgi:hypothetical protein
LGAIAVFSIVDIFLSLKYSFPIATMLSSIWKCEFLWETYWCLILTANVCKYFMTESYQYRKRV